MSLLKVKKVTVRDKRKIRIRKKILGTADCPRLTVYRSLNHIYAQLVDDGNGKTIGAKSTKSKDLAEQLSTIKGKVDAAKLVGKTVAKFATDLNITKVVFDRNGYLYHGRVKAVADGAREAGLNF
jgi:large subunit ribosomal protein L18